MGVCCVRYLQLTQLQQGVETDKAELNTRLRREEGEAASVRASCNLAVQHTRYNRYSKVSNLQAQQIAIKVAVRSALSKHKHKHDFSLVTLLKVSLIWLGVQHGK